MEMEVGYDGMVGPSRLGYLEAPDVEESSTEQSQWLVILRKRKQRSQPTAPKRSRVQAASPTAKITTWHAHLTCTHILHAHTVCTMVRDKDAHAYS